MRSKWLTAGRWIGRGLRPVMGDDGWVATRDRARRAGERVFVDGRLDGVIVMAGGNVYPEDIERVADAVDGVAASCVVGKPSAIYGEVPVLVIELAPGAPASAVTRAVEARLVAALPASRVPVHTRVATLPRTATGKVARHRVRASVGEEP